MAVLGKVRKLFSGVTSSTKQEVIAGPVDIAGYHILNTEAAPTYLQVFFALAANVTVGTTTPDMVIPLPASGGATMKFDNKGWGVKTGLTIASTTTPTGSTTAGTYCTLWRNH